MQDGGSLSRIRKNIPMPKNSSRIGMTSAQGQSISLVGFNVLMVDGEEAYMPLSDSSSEMDLQMVIKHHQQLHPLSTTGNIHKRKRRRYYIIVELLSWGV
jgi:uncharacterized protein YjfI (DUF2170 family)